MMPTVSVRYIVDDVDAAIAFYRDNLGFTEVMHPATGFAMMSRGDLRLLLSAPGGGPGGGQAMPDGSIPAPGDWNRFAIEGRPGGHGRRTPGGRCALPERDRHGRGRQADSGRRPLR